MSFNSFCALSIEDVSHFVPITSPFFNPSEDSIDCNFSDPNILIRSSSSETKKILSPGSPCLPERPLNWLSILLLSCLSVPMMHNPPETTTFS